MLARLRPSDSILSTDASVGGLACARCLGVCRQGWEGSQPPGGAAVLPCRPALELPSFGVTVADRALFEFLWRNPQSPQFRLGDKPPGWLPKVCGHHWQVSTAFRLI